LTSSGACRQLAVVITQAFDGFLVQILKIEHRITGQLGGADQLVEFGLNRGAIAVLRILDQEHHQERDDRGAGVDHQLPGVAEMEQRSARRPTGDDHHGDREDRR
jgi:hypothetical protein